MPNNNDNVKKYKGKRITGSPYIDKDLKKSNVERMIDAIKLKKIKKKFLKIGNGKQYVKN